MRNYFLNVFHVNCKMKYDAKVIKKRILLKYPLVNDTQV